MAEPRAKMHDELINFFCRIFKLFFLYMVIFQLLIRQK